MNGVVPDLITLELIVSDTRVMSVHKLRVATRIVTCHQATPAFAQLGYHLTSLKSE